MNPQDNALSCMNTQGWMSGMEPARGMEGLPLLPSLSAMVQQLPQSLIEVIDWFHQNNANVCVDNFCTAIFDIIKPFPVSYFDKNFKIILFYVFYY